MKANPYILLITLLAILVSCEQPETEKVTNVNSMEQLTASDFFNFDPTTEVNVTVTVLDNTNQPVKNVRIDLYTGDANDETAIKLTSGISDADGKFRSTFKQRNYRDSLFVKTRYIGIPSDLAFHLNENNMQIQIGGSSTVASSTTAYLKSILADPLFDYLGNFTTGTFGGLPEYLEPTNDVIDGDFLADINRALPERAPVPDAHPQYLASSNLTNTIITKRADVWVTFVHEGAGYKNSLCYYDYNTNTPPTTEEMIDSLHVIFPNLSYSFSGGTLSSGNKVHLGTFEPGTEIAWALVANGWNGNGVSSSRQRYYSDTQLNPENSLERRQHNVLLYDNARELFLLGFEDLNRMNGSDDDFNDAIFYVTTNPVDAAIVADVPELYPEIIDTDNDGVIDSSDDYPEDPDKAFDNFYPGEDDFGSLAYEDLWPEKGDYDFNDLVVDYNINQIANAQNKVTTIKASFTVKAVGAGYKNGFGIQLPMNPNLIESVTGTNVAGNIVTLLGNGTEANQSKATVIVFENVYDLFPTISHGYINTKEDADFIEHQTINIEINFTQPLSIDIVGLPPYNPFVIINQERGKEVHLPNYEPTDLADPVYFGTAEDDSDPAKGRYYRDNENLPWAMHIPTSFDYPTENTSIIQGHLVFDNWVLSDGFTYMDWYLDKAQYRNSSKLYRK